MPDRKSQFHFDVDQKKDITATYGPLIFKKLDQENAMKKLTLLGIGFSAALWQ